MQAGYWENIGLDNYIIRQWRVPLEVVSLEPDQVHVWRIKLNLQEPPQKRYVQALSADEINKAEQFYLEADRIRFAITRVVVRKILGNYLGMEPEGIKFAYNQFGKPYIANQCFEEELNFNISHAGDLSLLAMTLGRRIGVDLERIRDEESIDAIAKRFFAPAEVRQLLSIPDNLRQEAFFTCWTRKEAFVKAQGQGLSIPLDQFEVTFGVSETPRLIIANNYLGESRVWSMTHLDPGAGYIGALVVEGDRLIVSGWEWAG